MAKKIKLEEKLGYRNRNTWVEFSAKQVKDAYKFCEGYKQFLDVAKTERLAANAIVARAKAAGFKDINTARTARPGRKLYAVNRGKSVALIIMGKEAPEKGVRMVAAHIDAPRLDLKQNPLYEDAETQLALFKTHYYGGIKKYQWVSRALSLHGVVVKGNGEMVEVHIGEDPKDPVFTIADLLPHLYRNSQGKRRIDVAVKGEELNILVGSIPVEDKNAKKKVKLAVLKLLNEKYGLVEEDFISAELEIIPEGVARDVGFDRSMIGAYGQDDRAASYPTMEALMGIKDPKYTCIAFFVDKEEIGSDGNTGIKSRFLENVFGEVLRLRHKDYNDWLLRKTFSNTKVISSDVNAGINPTYKEVHESRNAAKIGFGIVLTKFTGSGGKYSANDANAEFVGEVRRVLNKNKIMWQAAELGKVDEGGGGTIAKFLAQHDMDVIDAGPALLGMHSPFEVSSKVDIYSTYQAYQAFFKNV